MDEIRNATVNINLNDGTINISGTEGFVEKNMATIFDFVQMNVLQKTQRVKQNEQVIMVDNNQKESNYEVTEEIRADRYISAGVYHIDNEDGTISILKKIPGKSKAEKAKNIALIVLHIRKEKVQGKEIIPLCEKHNCYDSTNFSTWFKNEKTNIIRKGSGANWTIELTQPGEESAIRLLEEMMNDKK